MNSTEKNAPRKPSAGPAIRRPYRFDTCYLDTPLIPGRALDIFMPENCTQDIAVFFVHGGGGRADSRTKFHSIMQEFGKRGYITASADYRLDAPSALEQVSTPRTRVYGLIGEKTVIFWVRDKAGNWKSELVEGNLAEIISGEIIDSVYGENQICDCYLPWEDRHVTAQLENGVCKFPDFKRSMVIRFSRS